MAPGPADDLELLEFATAADWESWLQDNHDRSPGVWLKLAKRGAPVTTVTHPQALEVAICFGWIDARKQALDDVYWLQRFTPRGRRSRWSQINRAKAMDLIAAGRMRQPGHAQIAAAQADGRWDAAYEAQSRATVPEDLQAALDRDPQAAAFFATLTGTRRYAFLHRLHHVVTPEARRRRIASYIELLHEGRTLN